MKLTTYGYGTFTGAITGANSSGTTSSGRVNVNHPYGEGEGKGKCCGWRADTSGGSPIGHGNGRGWGRGEGQAEGEVYTR